MLYVDFKKKIETDLNVTFGDNPSDTYSDEKLYSMINTSLSMIEDMLIEFNSDRLLIVAPIVVEKGAPSVVLEIPRLYPMGVRSVVLVNNETRCKHELEQMNKSDYFFDDSRHYKYLITAEGNTTQINFNKPWIYDENEASLVIWYFQSALRLPVDENNDALKIIDLFEYQEFMFSYCKKQLLFEDGDERFTLEEKNFDIQFELARKKASHKIMRNEASFLNDEYPDEYYDQYYGNYLNSRRW